MERHMKWLLNLLPVNKKREETGKPLLKYCFVLQWHIRKLWCVHIFFMLSHSSKNLNFVHVIKQTWKDSCISHGFLTEGFWWENPRKSWGKLMNISMQQTVCLVLLNPWIQFFSLTLIILFTVHACIYFYSNNKPNFVHLETFKGPRITESSTGESLFFYSVTSVSWSTVSSKLIWENPSYRLCKKFKGTI